MLDLESPSAGFLPFGTSVRHSKRFLTSASMLGDSSLADGYSEEQKNQARNYFARSILPIGNTYNVFQYVFY